MTQATIIEVLHGVAGATALVLALLLLRGLHITRRARGINLLVVLGVLSVAVLELATSLLGSRSAVVLLADVALLASLAAGVVIVPRVTARLRRLEQLLQEERARSAAAAAHAVAERERRELGMRDRTGGFDL